MLSTLFCLSVTVFNSSSYMTHNIQKEIYKMLSFLNLTLTFNVQIIKKYQNTSQIFSLLSGHYNTVV
jgi:hypothetical protein